MNHINDPEWLENLEDIKLNGTGKDDVNIMRNFHTAKKDLVSELKEKAEIENGKTTEEFVMVNPQETYI